MITESLCQLLTAFSLACRPDGFRGGRGTFYDASPAIEEAYAARCAIPAQSCCTFLDHLLTLDEHSADGNRSSILLVGNALFILMEENSLSIYTFMIMPLQCLQGCGSLW